MRKIINSTYLSLDGVVEAPHLWPPHGGQSDERAGRIQTDLLLSCDAVLMGRHTYDGFAPVWPTRSGDPYSDRINAMRKYVVSTTLRDPDWNNTEVIGRDVAATIARLKEEPGQDIVQYGYGAVTRLMLEHGLLDELRLWVHPLIVGDGNPSDLLFGAMPAVGFELADATPLTDGIVILAYRTNGRLERTAA
jgi:dihydrofolate reductase